MKKIKVAGIVLLALAFLFVGFSAAFAQQKLFELNTAFQPAFESFPIWYAKQKGWDKEEGLDVKMHFFKTGMEVLEGLPAKTWVITSLGSVPMVLGALRYGTYLISPAIDYSDACSVMVRPDSPIMKVKGWNKKFPELYGSPELIKGKTILVTTISTAHYTMSVWLKAFGLKDSDVVIKNIDQAQAVAAYESGVGDIAVLWMPFMGTGIRKGWKVAGNSRTAGSAVLVVHAGEKRFADQNPEIVAKFLRIYLRGVNQIKREGIKIVPDCQRFLKVYCGVEMDDESMKIYFESHHAFNYDEQLKLFKKPANGGESRVEELQREVVDTFTTLGRFKPEERDKALKMPYITDKFLKMVKQPIP